MFSVDLVFRPKKNAALPVLVVLLLLASCGPSPPAPDVVAESDLGTIGSSDLEAYILSQPEQRRSPPAGGSAAEWRRAMLEELLVTRVLETEAHSQGLDQTDEGRALLASRTEPILVQTVASRLIAERVNITEKDLRAFYDAHPEDFSHPKQIRVRHIFRRVARDAPPETWETARVEMEALLDEIHRGAHFGSLAREHSDSETAPLHGLIGRLDRGKFTPELEDLLWGLDEGEVSEVIRTPVGFQIFKVETHLGEFMMDFAEARTRLHRRLTREATEAAEAAILKELLDASGATFEPEALEHGDPEDVVFAFEEDSLTVDEFFVRLGGLGFSAARELTLREQLDRAVRDRLYLWKVESSKLADEPEVADQLQRIEQRTLIELARRKRLDNMIDRLDEQQLRDLYSLHKKRFQSPRLVHLRILTVDFPPGGNWYAIFEELEALAEEIRSGDRSFADASREVSSDFSAVRGGDVGTVRPDAFADWSGPQAQKRILELNPGQISEPILVEHYNTNRLTYERAGYMLVKLEALIEPETRPFDDARDRVTDLYLELNGREIQDQIRTAILRSVDARIYEENL